MEGLYRRSIHSLYHLPTLAWEPRCDAKVVLLINHSVPEGLSPKGNACLQRASAKACKFNQVPLVYFCFYLPYSWRWVIYDLAYV